MLVWTDIFWTDKYLFDGLVWTNIFWRNWFGGIYFRGTYFEKCLFDGLVWTHFGWIFSPESTACVTLVQFGQTVDYQKGWENSLKTIIRINNGLFSTLTLIAEGNIWDAGNPEPTSCNAFVRLPASKNSKIAHKKKWRRTIFLSYIIFVCTFLSNICVILNGVFKVGKQNHDACIHHACVHIEYPSCMSMMHVSWCL